MPRSPPCVASTTSSEQSEQSEQIAKAALDFYQDKLPSQKGKPREKDEWTVYAAIVATKTRTATPIATAATTAQVGVDNNSVGAKNDADDESASNKTTTTTTTVVISCATGTKCTAVTTTSQKQGTADAILHDSHAEVLARRGLVRVLCHEIIKIMTDSSKEENKKNEARPFWLLERYHQDDNHDDDNNDNDGSIKQQNKKKGYPQFRLRPGIQLHLYVSDSPCGDASIYPLSFKGTAPAPEAAAAEASTTNTSITTPIITTDQEKTQEVLQFTGAKVIVSQATKVSVEDCGVQACLNQDNYNHNHNDTSNRPHHHYAVARETIQLLGRLRTKSGRSNLQAQQRSDSMSCSDKIVRWSILGLQGRAMEPWLAEPIRLSSVIVSRDVRVVAVPTTTSSNNNNAKAAQLASLVRAIPDRVQAVREELLRRQENRNKNDNENDKESSVAAAVAAVDAILVPQVYVVDPVFTRGKASSEHSFAQQQNEEGQTTTTGSRKRKHNSSNNDDDKATMGGVGKTTSSSCSGSSCGKLSPTGVSLNWNYSDDSVEITIGARGIRQGKKPRTDQDIKALASRLSRRGLWNMIIMYPKVAATIKMMLDGNHNGNGNGGDSSSVSSSTECSYDAFKRKQREMEDWRRHIFSHGPLAGWIVSDNFQRNNDDESELQTSLIGADSKK